MSTPDLSPWGLYSSNIKLFDATLNATDLTANAVSQTVILGTIPEGAVAIGSFFILLNDFNNPGSSTYVVSDLSVGGVSVIPSDDFDIRAETANDGDAVSLGLLMPVSGDVSITVTCDINVSGTTQAELRVGIAYFVPGT